MKKVHVEGDIAINRPKKDVFAFVAQPNNLTEWVGPIIEVTSDAPNEAPALGSAFTIVQKFLGRHLTSPCEIVVLEPDRRFVYRTTGGPVPLTFTLLLRDATPGTLLSYTAEGEPGTFFSLVGPLFEKAANRQLTNDLETLKDLLESRTELNA